MNVEQLIKQRAELESLLYDYLQDTEQLGYVFYGVGDVGLGWYLVQTDYPDFMVLQLGVTWLEALASVQEMVAEWKADQEEDEGDE